MVNFSDSTTKKISILIVLAVTLWLVQYIVSYLNRAESYEFWGQIVKSEDNRLYVEGSYKLMDSSPPPKLLDNNFAEVIIKINPETKLVKTILYIPRALKSYKTDDLRKEHKDGLLDELKASKAGIIVLSEKNIFRKKKFTAKEIQYIEPVFE